MFRSQFSEICSYKEIYPDKGDKSSQGIVLCHYPIVCYNHNFQGFAHLYGHVHNSFEANMVMNFKRQLSELYERKYDMYNVGAMMEYMEYRPKTLKAIKARAEKE